MKYWFLLIIGIFVIALFWWQFDYVEKEIAWDHNDSQVRFQVCIDGTCEVVTPYLVDGSKHTTIHVRRGHHRVGVKTCTITNVCSEETAIDMDAR